MYAAFPRSGYYAQSDCLWDLGVSSESPQAYSPPSFSFPSGSPVFPMEDSNKTMYVAHCQLSHPLSAAPQTEHWVKTGLPMHSSTGPTGSPSVELTAVVRQFLLVWLAS